MRFAIAALLGLVSTTAIQDEISQDQVLLRDELESLLELVQSVETQEQSEIINTISVRKAVLQSLAVEMPQRKGAIRNEVTNLTNVVSKVIEEDFIGAMNELEARKEELVDINEHLQNLAVEAGSQEFNIKTTNVVGNPDAETLGFSSVTFNDDGTITGGTNWSGATSYNAETASAITGQWSTDPLANPDDTLYGAEWNAANNVYLKEGDAYYSGVWDGTTVKGLYNQPETTSSGTFEATMACDAECKAKKIAGKMGDGIAKGIDVTTDAAKKLAEKTKKALNGPNGVAIGLGIVGGALAVCAMCYCYCKKKPDLMSEGSEGGKKQTRESLLVQIEEA